MICTQKSICLLPILAVILSTAVMAEHIKVDMDARYDATASGFLSWQAADGNDKTIGDLDITLDIPNLPAYTSWRIDWYGKRGLGSYSLACDCLHASYDDDTIRRPSFNGGTIVMTIDGLTEGTHTIISYHNSPWPVEKYDRTICACKIYVNEVEQLTVQPSQYVQGDDDTAATFFTVEVTAGGPVVIKFEPVGDPNTQIFTALLSGFEIDSPAAPGDYAVNPEPTDGEEHVFANNDDPAPGSAGTAHTTLSWTPSTIASWHDVYLGTDANALQDANAYTTGIYKGRQTDTTYQASNLDSKNTYYWRIDEVRSNRTVVKGNVWRFRTRHLAFPAAEGYGRFARGGRHGRVIEVTNLNDSGPGSLREAIEVEKGPRTIVFRVGGTIFLDSKLVIPSDGGDVYVAGQTAPGEGICVSRYAFGMLGASDVIIRFIRTRVGDYCQEAMDGMGMASSDHCILDHCSISWSIDEGHSSRSAHNITFQRNIISEALNNSYHYSPHAYAASISGNIGSYHHNLLAHCTARNWSLAGALEPDAHHYAGYVDIRNNVIYNWVSRTTDGGCKNVNFVNNYYKPGPAGGVTWIMRPDGDELSLGDMQLFYLCGNIMEGILDDPDADNWDYIDGPRFATEEECRVDTPFYPSYVTTHTAHEAYTNVLTDVGATRPMRDPIDTRIVNEVSTGTYTYYGSYPGIIDSQKDVGGYREYAGGPAPADSDHDGLPDWWENQLGFDPNSSTDDYSDTNGDPDGDGYTNLEDYLEYLAQGGTQFPTYNCTAGIGSDLDDDCQVNFLDYAIFADAWASASPQGDIDGDSDVDLYDVAKLATDWLTCNRAPDTECWQ